MEMLRRGGCSTGSADVVFGCRSRAFKKALNTQVL